MQLKKVLERVKRYVSLTLSPWVIFHAFCRLLNLFKINIFERFFQDSFGVSNSFDQKVWNQIRPTICRASSGSKLFAMFITRRLEGNELTPFPPVKTFSLFSLSTAFCCNLLLSSAYVLRQPILQTVMSMDPDQIRLLSWVHSVCIHDQKKSEVHLNLVFNIK